MEPVPTPSESVPTPGVVRLLGTGHVFPLRNGVHAEVFDMRPGVVALELDHARMQSLLTPPEDRQNAKAQGLGYRLMARFQTKMAADFGGNVGDEMLAGREAAMLIGARVALVDRPVQLTYQRLLKALTWSEKIRLLGSAMLAMVPGPWFKGDLDRVMQGDPKLIEEVGRQYPTLMRVLLHERNEHMAKALASLARLGHNVVAVLGDAHVPGVEALLVAEGIAVETVRLPALMERSKAKSEASWQVEIDDA